MIPVSQSRIAATLRGTAAVAAAAAFADIAPAATWLPPVRRSLAPGLTGLGTPGHLALTFDDGPDPEGTPAVLAALAALGWRATFFMLGEQVRAHATLASAVAADGHEVALHGDTHRYHFPRSPRGLQDDLDRALTAVEETTGVRPRWFRPPYGVLTLGGIAAARRAGLRPLLWSAWGKEWRSGATAEGAMAELRRGTLSGGTVLLHDSDLTSARGTWRVTVDALALLAEEVAATGLRVGPVGDHGLLGSARAVGSPVRPRLPGPDRRRPC